MTLQTKQMWKIYQPIEEQIKKLSKLLNENPKNSSELISIRKLIVDQLYTLATKFENATNENVDSYQDMKKKVTSIIEEFCTIDFNKNENDLKYQLDEEIFNTLIARFLFLLQHLEKVEIHPLKQNLEDCLEYVKEMGKACEIEDLENIKELGTSVVDIFGPLLLYRKSLLSNYLSNQLALFCGQLCTSFSMLVKVIKEQHMKKSPLYTLKKYVCDRISLCIESIINILDSSKPSDEDECYDQENNFVYRIDLVLDIITSISSKTQIEQIKDCDDLWLGIEDVFAHAMSIVQVCQPYNFKAITGACQTILTKYESFKSQLHSNPPDPSMNNLFMNSLSDSVYRLERKINISVLTLVMEVFSEPFSALRKLIKICGTSLNASGREKDDLNSAIDEFDQITDKTVQIGKFSIACCKDKNRAIQIRNCLASLESLEMELVPAISAFYLHPNNEEMRAFVKLLTEQWQMEIYKFQHTVNLIIDPTAYCQIILDDLQERINEMSNCLENRGISLNQVQIIIQRAISLSTQINTTVEDIGQENIEKQTITIIRKFKAAIYETNVASKELLVSNATVTEQLRVINRCRIILKVVKQLLPALTAVIDNSLSINTVYSSPIKGQSDLHVSNQCLNFSLNMQELSLAKKSPVCIRTPYSVKSCKQPLSIQPANSVPRNESDLSILIPYIEKGKLMHSEWSVMYKTPNSCKIKNKVENQLKMRNLSNVRLHLFSRDSFIENDEIDLTTESLDLTNILEKLTGLSTTLSSITNDSTSVLEKSQNVSFLREKVRSQRKVQINKITKKIGDFSPSYGGGDALTLSKLEKLRNTKKKEATLMF